MVGMRRRAIEVRRNFEATILIFPLIIYKESDSKRMSFDLELAFLT
jgi:hypothetical protein